MLLSTFVGMLNVLCNAEARVLFQKTESRVFWNRISTRERVGQRYSLGPILLDRRVTAISVFGRIISYQITTY